MLLLQLENNEIPAYRYLSCLIEKQEARLFVRQINIISALQSLYDLPSKKGLGLFNVMEKQILHK